MPKFLERAWPPAPTGYGYAYTSSPNVLLFFDGKILFDGAKTAHMMTKNHFSENVSPESPASIQDLLSNSTQNVSSVVNFSLERTSAAPSTSSSLPNSS